MSTYTLRRNLLPRVEIAVDAPVAMLAVRLNDVSSDGASRRITYGMLNPTHCAGHAQPQPLPPDKRFKARVRLNDVACRIDPGHSLR